MSLAGRSRRGTPREVDAFLSSLGTTESAAAAAALLTRGADGATAVTDALARGAPLGDARANGRAVFEELEAYLCEVARAHPETLLEAASRHPALTKQFAFVSALTRVASVEAADCLAPLLRSRGGTIRWLVLDALLERRDPRAVARLGDALADRDSLVVFRAASALRTHGTVADLPRLEELARATKTAPGTREAAWDAIEAICARSGRALPPTSPTPRLIAVPLPEGAEPVVGSADAIAKDDVLARARAGGAPTRSPCDAIVVEVEQREIVLRRR